ncbi:MAG: 30S ribosomal protein S7 [Patescibacteria group bacterium]|nr:30S ribosomal protein S7 [Patescibacteria group bacterium]
MRHKKTEKRKTEPDNLYNSRLVAKFINGLMKDGKKSVAQSVLYGAFDLLSEKGQNPLEAFEKAIQNVGPKIEVKPRRVGGASYQVPTEVRGDRKTALAIRWIIQAARARSNKDFHTMKEKLAAEMMDAIQNQGAAIKKRDTVLKMAEANKAFAHFRW